MYILHEGPGTWDGTIINPHNPIRRDVYQLRPNGHLVIQFDAAANPDMRFIPAVPLRITQYYSLVSSTRRLAISLPHCMACICRLFHPVPHQPRRSCEDENPQRCC